MKFTVAYTVVICVLLMAGPLPAEEGRYQAVSFGREDSTGFSVFILDTKEGHCWTWTKSLFGDKSTGSIRYEGRIKPGEKPGEIIQGENSEEPKSEVGDRSKS